MLRALILTEHYESKYRWYVKIMRIQWVIAWLWNNAFTTLFDHQRNNQLYKREPNVHMSVFVTIFPGMTKGNISIRRPQWNHSLHEGAWPYWAKRSMSDWCSYIFFMGFFIVGIIYRIYDKSCHPSSLPMWPSPIELADTTKLVKHTDFYRPWDLIMIFPNGILHGASFPNKSFSLLMLNEKLIEK